MENTNELLKKIIPTISKYLVIITAYCYFMIFIYNWAYFQYFNININFLSINPLTDLSILTFEVIKIILLIIFIYSTVFFIAINKILYHNNPYRFKNKKTKREFILYDFAISFGSSYFLLLFSKPIVINNQIVLYLTIIIISIAKICIIYTLLYFIEKIYKRIQAIHKIWTKTNREEKEIEMHILTWIGCPFIILVITIFGGYSSAKLKSSFEIINDNYIVLYSNNEYAIVSHYEKIKSNQNCSKTIFKVDLTKQNDIELTRIENIIIIPNKKTNK